jgi:hypothetical protein
MLLQEKTRQKKGNTIALGVALIIMLAIFLMLFLM